MIRDKNFLFQVTKHDLSIFKDCIFTLCWHVYNRVIYLYVNSCEPYSVTKNSQSRNVKYKVTRI